MLALGIWPVQSNSQDKRLEFNCTFEIRCSRLSSIFRVIVGLSIPAVKHFRMAAADGCFDDRRSYYSQSLQNTVIKMYSTDADRILTARF
jgi:hypothetical protein